MLRIAARGLALAAMIVAVSDRVPRPAHAQPASPAGSVVVQPGDNLFRIALRYGTTVEALMRVNRLASPDWIIAGQRIALAPRPAGTWAPSPMPAAGAVGGAPGAGVMPSPAGVPAPVAAPAAAEPARAAPAAAGSAAGGQYVVQPGDNLFRIALRHGSTVDALARLNGLASADMIRAGQVLRLPGGDNRDAGYGVGAPDSTPAAPAGAGGPAPAAPPLPAGRGAREIVIDLSDQTLTAFEDGAAVRRVVVSTGKPSTPTPVGFYRIYSRYRSQDMAGPGYYAPDVPFVQYFIGGYALHGTYWHTAFGTPVSHGCVNLPTAEAEWMWGWADIGTPVTVQW